MLGARQPQHLGGPVDAQRLAGLLRQKVIPAVFVVIAVALNAMLWWLVIRPVTKLSRLADRVSLGEAIQINTMTGGDVTFADLWSMYRRPAAETSTEAA